MKPFYVLSIPQEWGIKGAESEYEDTASGFRFALLTLRAGFRSHDEAWPSEGEAVLRPYGNGSFI